MTAPTITNVHGFLTDCNTIDESTTGTADSGSTTTTVDAERTEATTDHWKGYYIHYDGGPNIGLARLITGFTPGTDTITHVAFPNAVAAGHTYFLTDWGEYRSNMADADASLTVENGDLFKIEAVFDQGATDEYAYYEKDITDISSDVYTTVLFRYKTSASANGAKAKIELVFTSGSQVVLAGNYSTAWTTASVTVTPSKTIDKIRFFADDDGTNGTFYVYYEFLLLHKGPFTFPNVGRGLRLRLPMRNAELNIPGRSGDIDQNLGTKSARVELSVDLAIGNWKRSGDSVNGEVFMDIWHNRKSEPWQWLDLGNRKFKVQQEEPIFTEDGVNQILEVSFKEYRLGSAEDETYAERLGL